MFAPQSASVAAELAAGFDDAVTRDDDGDSVVGVCGGNGAHGGGFSDSGGLLAVGAGLSEGYFGEGAPGGLLELGAALIEGDGELGALAGEVLGELGFGLGEERVIGGDEGALMEALEPLNLGIETDAVGEFEEGEAGGNGNCDHGTERGFDPAGVGRL